MASKRCKLYDENLVHNIMLSTGLSVLEYIRENAKADSDEVGDFVTANAEVIITDTIRHLKEATGQTQPEDEEGMRDWPSNEEEE
jgi:hypothetical protein